MRDAYRTCFTVCIGTNSVWAPQMSAIYTEGEGERCLQGMFHSVYGNKLCGHLRCQLFTQKGKVRDIFRVCFAVRIGANSVCMGTAEVGYLHIVCTEGEGERCLQGMRHSVYGNKLCVWAPQMSAIYTEGEGVRCLQGVLSGVCWNKPGVYFYVSIPSLKF